MKTGNTVKDEKKVRVLVIGGLPPPIGGVETVMENMMSLRPKGFELIAFDVAKSRLIKSNIIFNSINFIYRCIKLFFVMLKVKPDIVHVHFAAGKDFWQKAVFMLISKMFKNKTILHMHSGKFPEFYNTSRRKNLIKRLMHMGDGIIVLTKGWEVFYREILRCKNIHILNNSIDLEVITRYASHHKRSKTKRMLFVGRIETPKGIYELLWALKKLRDMDIHLYVMGPFMKNEKEIRALCDKYGISDKITFLGIILGDERFKYFANADIFVLPSYSEGLPLSILEAMAFGMPVVATDVGAISEVVKKNNGILVRPKDADELSKAIRRIIDSMERKDYKESNITVIREKYTKQVFEKKLLDIYGSFA